MSFLDKITKKNLKRIENCNKIEEMFMAALVDRLDISKYEEELSNPICEECYDVLLAACLHCFEWYDENYDEDVKGSAIGFFDISFFAFENCIEECNQAPHTDKTEFKVQLKTLLEEHIDRLIDLNAYFTFKTYNK